LAKLLRPGHPVVQGQTVTCCECGSVVARLWRALRKDDCSARGLHLGQAACRRAFLESEGMKGAEIIDSWLLSMDRTVYHNKIYTSGSKCLKAAEPVLLMQTGRTPIHIRKQTKRGAC
jgi:hypothetical protein